MTLPKPGTRVRVWPLHPRVQADAQPVSAKHGGRFMSDEGHDVIWSPFHVALLRGGAICLHDPKPAKSSPSESKAAAATKPIQDASKAAG